MINDLDPQPVEEAKLPPMEDSWFDGEKESVEIKFTPCTHQLELVSATVARCTRCPAQWQGYGIQELVKVSQLQTS